METLARVEPPAASTIYEFCCRFPTPLSVSVSAQRHVLNVFTVSADWVQLEPERGKRLRYSQQWIMLMANEAEQTIRSILPAPPCIPKQEEILSCHSPSGTLRAVLRETSCYQFLEIWDCHGLRKSLNLNEFNKHGKIYEDAQFGSLAWSECERRLVYVAEKIQSNETSGTLSSTGNDRSVYCDDWGESLTCKSLPVLCVANIERGTVFVLKGVPSHVSPGQALWFPGGQALLFVGWWHEPFRLGLKFCSNRRSALFKLDLNGNCELLSGDNLSVSSPRLSPDGCSLAYLQGQVFGPHCQCLSLQLYDLQNQTTSTLLDVVHRPTTASSDGFAGVYEALPASCWSSDSQRIVFSSARRNFKDLFVVDRHTRRVTRLSGSKNPSHSPHPSPPLPRSHLPSSLPPPPPPLPNPRHHEAKKKIEDEEWGSWKLLSVNRDLMVVCCSSPNRPPCLRVGFLPSAGEGVAWQTLGQPAVTVDLSWKVLDVKPSPEEDNLLYSDIDFSSVLVKPPRLHEAKIPLVVYIHGGPHSQFPAEWNISTVGLAMLGFAVLMVNYRGSTGFGQDSILSLIGQIGNQDVKDVHRAVLTALESDITLDSQRVAVIGGSHGGFLSCHLVGQYPDFYKACVARNPVINAATLLGTSDIVDWRYSCVGLQYSFEQLPTPEALDTMLEKSPIRHAAQIKAPVLLMLGGRDRRVSPHQGLELYRALKSRGSSIRLLWYAEDGHSLAGVDTQANCFLNMTLWLQQHLNVVEH